MLFIVVAVSTDITNWPAFVAYFAIIITITQIAKLPIITVFKRSLIEVPFVLFALLMPFFGTGEVVEIGSLNLYVDGLLAGASIVVKGTLGILVAINLSATTTAREILNGLEILKMPTPMVQIASFMLRYVNVVNDDAEGWSSVGSAASSCWSWASMAGVVLWCHQRALWRIRAQDQGMVLEWVRPVGIGRCTCRFGWGCRW